MMPRSMRPRFLSLPIRHALEGASWASLSVRWIPTEDQQEQRRDEIESLWLPGERPEVRPPLHPLGGKRFPFERFYSRLGRVNRTRRPAGCFAPRRRDGLTSPRP